MREVPLFAPQDPRGIAIAEVSEVLGVPMPTLRSWERRYGIPQLTRDLGRHRRYFPLELHALRLMRDEIARGQKASVAAETVLGLVGGQGPADEVVRLVLADSEKLDTASIRSRLDTARAMLGLAACIDDVILPAMRQVGVWWAIGHCDEKQERMTTEAMRAWLDKASAYAPSPIEPFPILLAGGPSDMHTIGIEALALMLRTDGWPCRVLGAHIATDILVTATRATAAAAVVVVSHLATGRIRAVASIVAVHHLGIPVFYAGNAFATARARKSVPGIYLNSKIGDACELIISSLAHPAIPGRTA